MKVKVKVEVEVEETKARLGCGQGQGGGSKGGVRAACLKRGHLREDLKEKERKPCRPLRKEVPVCGHGACKGPGAAPGLVCLRIRGGFVSLEPNVQGAGEGRKEKGMGHVTRGLGASAGL